MPVGDKTGFIMRVLCSISLSALTRDHNLEPEIKLR